MQVMTGAEFKQTQVVIGQQTKTRGFSVSDDPMLMSILSTGLYQNPLKSMIQEAVFNAWDAHKAAGTTDKPVEIVFTDDNQLIISDSGLGIAPEDMYEIYCVYGASTKRDDNDQTGGFGLGCKAPFAYTDSFRVTSSHGGKRHLYLVSRANDDNDGKPGITELVGDLDSPESGLMVSIPLKDDRDAVKAYEILKNKIFPYSGIKWTLDFKAHDQEEGQELALAPGKFVLEPGRINQHGGFTAQYGGVAYEVPYAEEYQNEYNYLANVIGDVGSIRAGFASGTLTPLPSREGLNLSERTVQNLRVEIQSIIDELNTFLHPMMDLAINWVAHCLGQREEDLYDSKGDEYSRTPFEEFHAAGFNKDFEDVLTREEVRMFRDQPIEDEENRELIERLRLVIMSSTQKLIKGVGADWYTRRRAIAWSVQNGHNRERFDILKQRRDRGNAQTLTNRINQRTVEKTIANMIAVSNLVNIKPHLRVRHHNDVQSSRYTFVAEETEPASYSKTKIYEKLVKEKKHSATTRIKLDELRPTQGSRSAPKCLDPENIVLAHTIKDGNHFSPSMNISEYSRGRKVPIFVIGTSAAKMEKAKTFLENQGYTVYVAPKYVEPEYTPLEPKENEFEGWPMVDSYEDGFASSYDFCKEPTLYIQYSKTQQRDEAYHRDRFDHKAVMSIRSYFNQDKIVVINHPNKLRTIKKMGVVSVAERIDALVRKFIADPEFTKKLAMHKHARKYGNLPDGLLQLPEFSKVLGLPYIRTRELSRFREVINLLDVIASCDSDVFCSSETRTLIKTKLVPDPTSVSRCESILDSLEILDGRVVRDRINGMSEGERKVYSEKLARFIRTTAD